MKQFIHLLKYDFILLQRNKIIVISLLASALYVGVFKGLSNMGNVDKLLILVIFNDPALLGFLFVGVMVLFEKNENTLQALSVSPMLESNYILSKSISLTIISLACCYAMAFASRGFDFHFVHYGFATILTTLLFSFLGFVVVAGETTFNRYILKALGAILFLTIPFLGYFGVTPRYWYLWLPTQPAIDLFQIAFDATLPLNQVIYAYLGLIFWVTVSYFWALKQTLKSIKK